MAYKKSGGMKMDSNNTTGRMEGGDQRPAFSGPIGTGSGKSIGNSRQKPVRNGTGKVKKLPGNVEDRSTGGPL